MKEFTKGIARLHAIFIAFLLPISVVLLAVSPVNIAHAQSLVSKEASERAIRLANHIESKKLILEAPSDVSEIFDLEIPEKEKLKRLRHYAMDSVFLRIKTQLSDILPIYETEALRQQSQRDIAIAKIIKLQDEMQRMENNSREYNLHLDELRAFRANADWFVAQRSILLESNLTIIHDNLDVGLRDTQAALSLIPSELTQDVLEAQYETYDLIAFFQLVLNNIDSGISSTEQVIEKGLAHNRPIDGISYINNLTYVFNSWYEYETAEKLAESLFRLNQKSEGNGNAYAYLRFAQAQNNAEHYDQALTTLENIEDTSSLLNVELSVILAKAVALAGLGRTEQAQNALEKYGEITQKDDTGTPEHENVKLQVLALIAANENNANATLNIQNQRIKSIVQTQLDRQAKGIQSLQANLENDKNRVAEREAALMRETELKQSELEAKQRSNMFLMALAASLLLIALCAIAFGVWRQKISKILELAAHDAKAGDRAKSQFLSVMSHELRTPLNGIIGIAGILSEKGETKELRNYNKLILKSGENLLELLSGILDMAQMESGKLSIVTAPASIRQIIDGLYQAAKSDVDETKVQFTCFVSDNVPDDLMLDSIRVKQSLSNLISNAVRFTDQGRIHIHTTMSEPDRKGVRDLTMIVADTGQGITDEVKEKLFKPFVQADSSLTRTHDGAGIGLAVTRGLSRLMGGDVTMSSTAGRGSEFKMVIKTCIAREAEFNTETNRPVFEIVPSTAAKIDFSPAVSIEKLRADAEAKEKAQIQQDLYGSTQKVEPAVETQIEEQPVSVDINFSDEDDVEFETIAGVTKSPEPRAPETQAPTLAEMPNNPREGFSRNHPRSDTQEIEPDQLSGLNILVVEDIEANLEILCSLLEPVGCSVSCAENGQIALEMMKSQTFDAVLMDIRMPVLDGIEATRAIRSLPEPQCNTAIIALTADASAENNAECLAAGADVFLTKPVIVSELFSSIRFARRKQFRQKQQALSA